MPNKLISAQLGNKTEAAAVADIRRATDEFRKIQEQLLTHLEENPEFVTEFLRLAELYNAAVSTAKSKMKAFPGTGAVTLPDIPFRRRAGSDAQVYDPALLPPSLLAIPGVATAVDTEAVEAAAEIHGFDISGAATTKTRSPAVYGPKEIVFDVGEF